MVILGSWTGFGQAPTKPTFPHVVATFKRWNQTAPIPTKDLFTPKSFGVYRYSYVFVLTSTCGSDTAQWVGHIEVVDGGGSDGSGSFLLNCNVLNVWEYTNPFRQVSGRPVRFSVTSQNGDTSGSKYNVFVVIEQIM
jgi:hypothetical protein